MEPTVLLIITASVCLIAGTLAGKFVFSKDTKKQVADAEAQVQNIIKEAELKAENIKKEKELPKNHRHAKGQNLFHQS